MFSVIIPTYNREEQIAKAVESVLDQSIEDYEIIIVDNGSEDATKKVVEDIINSYPSKKIQYFYQKNTGSPAGSRNTGIKKANFNWISFLDSDDLWLPKKLEEIKKRIATVPAEVVAIAHWEIHRRQDKSRLRADCNRTKPRS